jgi:hypothetical protein
MNKTLSGNNQGQTCVREGPGPDACQFGIRFLNLGFSSTGLIFSISFTPQPDQQQTVRVDRTITQ